MNKFIPLALACLALTACGLEKDGSATSTKYAQSNSMSYDFTLNGCATGKHSFTTLDAMCDGLKDDALNNSCAYSTRYAYFKEKCGSRTW